MSSTSSRPSVFSILRKSKPRCCAFFLSIFSKQNNNNNNNKNHLIVFSSRLQERLEAKNLFASKQVEEEAKKESPKTFTPGDTPIVSEVAEEERSQKMVAPTPEQITAIKVFSPCHSSFYFRPSLLSNRLTLLNLKFYYIAIHILLVGLGDCVLIP